MLKSQLEKELKECKKIIEEYTLRLAPKEENLTERIGRLEEEVTKDIKSIVEKLINETGKIPTISINYKNEDSTEQIKIPVFCPSNINTNPQKEAVKKLVKYCIDRGDWCNKSQAKNWIISKIREC